MVAMIHLWRLATLLQTSMTSIGRWLPATTCNCLLIYHLVFGQLVLKRCALGSLIVVGRNEQRWYAISCSCNNSFLITVIWWPYLIVYLCFILINTFKIISNRYWHTIRTEYVFLSWHTTVLCSTPELLDSDRYLASLSRRDRNWCCRLSQQHVRCQLERCWWVI